MKNYLPIIILLLVQTLISCNTTIDEKDRIVKQFKFNLITNIDYNKVRNNYKQNGKVDNGVDVREISGIIDVNQNDITINIKNQNNGIVYQIGNVTKKEKNESNIYTYKTDRENLEVITNSNGEIVSIGTNSLSSSKTYSIRNKEK